MAVKIKPDWKLKNKGDKDLGYILGIILAFLISWALSLLGVSPHAFLVIAVLFYVINIFTNEGDLFK